MNPRSTPVKVGEMRKAGWKHFCQRAASVVVAGVIFAFLSCSLNQPPQAGGALSSFQSSSAANTGIPQDISDDSEPGETESESSLNAAEDFLLQKHAFPNFNSARDRFSVVFVLGFSLERPAAVHRPPWV